MDPTHTRPRAFGKNYNRTPEASYLQAPHS